MELDSKTAAIYRELQPGGFILFGRNIQSPKQLRQLIDDLRELCDQEPIITIDQEGGRVSRLRLIGNEPPNAQQFREKNDLSLIQRHGDITGRILRLFGFNLDLCPVLDVSLDDEADNSLKGRCYGSSVEEVIEKAGVFNSALRATGVLSCGKHFPGYTNAGRDPHHELPFLDRSREEMEALELIPFRQLAGQIDSMMTGHISVTGLDAINRPASLSPVVIQKLLREEMGFSGLIMTDDLDMGAILTYAEFDEVMRLALQAGNDLLMLCHRVELAAQIVKAIESLPTSILDRALQSVETFRTRLVPPDVFSEEKFYAIDQEIWQLRVDTLGEERAKERSVGEGKRSPVEVY